MKSKNRTTRFPRCSFGVTLIRIYFATNKSERDRSRCGFLCIRIRIWSCRIIQPSWQWKVIAIKKLSTGTRELPKLLRKYSMHSRQFQTLFPPLLSSPVPVKFSYSLSQPSNSTLLFFFYFFRNRKVDCHAVSSVSDSLALLASGFQSFSALREGLPERLRSRQLSG